MSSTNENVIIVIAHYGIRKITESECRAALARESGKIIFVDFEIANAPLKELYHLPFENIAVAQERKFNDELKPILEQNPSATIAYFGLAPIPIGFHLGALVENTFKYMIYQWHHGRQAWYKEIDPPSSKYVFKVNASPLPKEIHRGKGSVSIRIATSFTVDPIATHEVVSPVDEFEISLEDPHVDSLYSQANIAEVVEKFQLVLGAYGNMLRDREEIHLFLASSAGLPFALGTRINATIYPFIQTYQYGADESPKYIEAISIAKATLGKAVVTEAERAEAIKIREAWERQLQDKIKAYIQVIREKASTNWLQGICAAEQYAKILDYVKVPWSKVPDVTQTSLNNDKIYLPKTDLEDGFEYIEKTKTWHLDDGFMARLQQRLLKNPQTDLMQAGRLFFFHEALHYSANGHNLTSVIANGIGRFPKVIEEADYQADVWALLCEYKYSEQHDRERLKNGIKSFFCNAIDTAVETMWSFIDNGSELKAIEIRTLNRFTNWYWQWLRIEKLNDDTLEEVIRILLDKPIIEFAGAPIVLRAHRTIFKLGWKGAQKLEFATFVGNRVYRHTPTAIDEFIDGFRKLQGEKIKKGLESFQLAVNW